MLNPYSYQQNIIPPIRQSILQQYSNTLNLNQIENYQLTQKFFDSSNTEWTLVKSSNDSTIDIPDPKSIQIIDYWNHEFPNIKNKIYVYVVEGIKQPRVETEQPTRIMYQWFSTVFIPTFTPSFIAILLSFFCKPHYISTLTRCREISLFSESIQQSTENKDELIKIDELTNDNN